jgi:ABC-type spermidine/putrescine transport system permease subunit I
VLKNWGSPAYLPLLVIMLVGFVAPMCVIVKMSLFDPDFTLKHYVTFFTNATYLQVFLRTFKTAFTVTLGCLLLGYPVAFFLTCVKDKTANYLRIFIVIPFWVSILIRTFAWKVILSNTGVINTSLLSIGAISSPLSLMYNSFAVHISMIHILLPFMILTLYGAMKGINPGYFNAALSLGARPGKAFLQVYFPMSVPGILSGTLMVFIMALGFYITPSIMGGSNDTMLPVVIELQVNRALNWNLASAMAVILLVTTMIIVGIYTKFLGADKLGATS